MILLTGCEHFPLGGSNTIPTPESEPTNFSVAKSETPEGNQMESAPSLAVQDIEKLAATWGVNTEVLSDNFFIDPNQIQASDIILGEPMDFDNFFANAAVGRQIPDTDVPVGKPIDFDNFFSNQTQTQFHTKKQEKIKVINEKIALLLKNNTIAEQVRNKDVDTQLEFDLNSLIAKLPVDEKILVQKEAADITITDAKGNPIKGINVIHGYITNINEDRIDIKEIGHSYARRWSIEHAFNRLDDKMRRFASKTVRILPGFRKRMIAQIALVSKVGRKKAGHKPIGSLLFSPASPRIRPHIKSKMPLKTIVLTGNVTDVEFPVIQQFEKIENHHMLYQETQRLQSVQIAKSHIVWLGHGEIYKEKYQLNIDAEHRIKTFVSRGGIVITSGQDVTGLRRRSAG